MESLHILQLSDTHLRGERLPGTPDPDALWRRALEALDTLGELDLIVLSGDLSDDGSIASYGHLRTTITQFAARHGDAALVWVPGNHDSRPGFRAVLGPGLSRAAVAAGADERPVFSARTIHGFRIIGLDSSVPGRSHGLVDDEQLAWLRDLLSVDCGAGSVVVVHHPPVAPVTPLHQGIGLINTERLADVLADSDVRLVLSGHYHHALIDSIPGRDGAIPVVVAPGIINHNQVLAPRGHELASAASGATLVELTTDPGS